jgi:saccharopine dehydrogenase-like NADP-dependent oxidoreductase
MNLLHGLKRGVGSVPAVAVLGAGHIGELIAKTLHDSGDYNVFSLDVNPNVLCRLNDYGIHTNCVDMTDPERLKQALHGVDIVVNALPHHFAKQVAQLSNDCGCHYFDLTEDVAATKAIRDMAEGSRTVLMPQCGLAPGFIGIAGHHLALAFDQVLDLKMRVGALPMYPGNALKYNLTWSLDGLINEYCHPCEAVRDGIRTELHPMEGLENFAIDGVAYESFNTSGGIGTLCETLEGKVQNLDYKTIRYPGHCELMKTLLNDFRLKNDRETLKRIMKNSIPITKQDLVIILASATGYRGGELVNMIYSTKILATESKSAIQIATVAGICVAIDLFCSNRLPQSGFICQEQIALPAFLNNRFGAVYGRLAGEYSDVVDGSEPQSATI